MNFFFIDIATMVAAGLGFVALITARRRYVTAAVPERHGAAQAASRPVLTHAVKRGGNKTPRARTTVPVVHYVDPARLVYLR